MKQDTIKAIVDFIQMARAESLSLVPRLSDGFAENQQTIADRAKEVLTLIKEDEEIGG